MIAAVALTRLAGYNYVLTESAGVAAAAGYPGFVAGACLLARPKGHNAALGCIALIGLIPGFLLLLVPDRPRDRP